MADLQTSAFRYLIVRGVRNRLASRLRRAKNPRYALAMAIGVVYFWFIYLRPVWVKRPPGHQTPGIDAGSPLLLVIGTAFLLVMAAITWFVDNGPSNLALDKAESAFILPAPVSRRALVGYKLLRAQMAILTTVVVWTFLIRRGNASVSWPLRAIGVWLVFTTTNLHRTGAEIVKAAWWQRGGAAIRKHWAPTAVVLLTIVGLALSVGLSYHALSAAWARGMKEFLVALAAALDSGLARVVLWPIRATLGPLAASSNLAWLSALPAALVILALHLAWLGNVDDEAVDVAVDRATQRIDSVRERMDGRRMAARAVKPRPDIVLKTMQLSSTGWPPTAIVWKNALAMRRRTRNGFSTLMIFALLPTGIGAIMMIGGGAPANAAAIWGVIFAGEAVLVGPILLRNDLRSDMVNLTALKLLPLSGSTLVAAEILSAVVPLAVLETFTLAVSAVAVQFRHPPMLTPLQTGLLYIVIVPSLLVVNAAFIGIQNAAPVLFPAWTKLDAFRGGGVEAMGQGVIVIVLFALLVAAMLAVPAALVTGVIVLGRSHLTIALVSAVLLGAAALALEVAALILILGRTFERTEPAEIVG